MNMKTLTLALAMGLAGVAWGADAPTPATSAPPAGTQPYLFNPFDPNAWTQFWQVPGQQPAAPAKK